MMARRNKPAQRVKRSFDVLDDWLEPSDDNDVVVCSSAKCEKINTSSKQLDILQDDHFTSSSPSSKSRYNPLSFIKDDPPHHSGHRERSPPAVVVDCRDDEQFIAYGKSDQQPVNKSHSQYIMSVSSSLPPATNRHRTRSLDAKAVHHGSGSCDPITVLSDEEMDVQNSSDHVISGDNSSDHVTSGDNSSDHVTSTTIQRSSSVRRKRRKLLTLNKVSDWHPSAIGVDATNLTTSVSTSYSSTVDAASARTVSPITVHEHDIVEPHDPIAVKGYGSPTTSNNCNLIDFERRGSPTTSNNCDPIDIEGRRSPTTSNNCDPIDIEGRGSPTSSNTCDLINIERHSSPTTSNTLNLEGHGSLVANTCDLTSTEGHGSITTGNTCDLTSVEGHGSITSDSHEHSKCTAGMVTSDTSDRGKMKKSEWSSLTRSSITSVKSVKTFYNRNSNRPLYDYAPFHSKTKYKPKAQPLFKVQGRLKNYKIPHKSQSSQQQHTQVSSVANDNSGDKKKSPLVEALSMIEQSSNTGESSNTSNSGGSSNNGASNISSSSSSHSSKYFQGTRTSLERPGIRSHHMGNQTSMLNSVHLDCSRGSIGTIHGIAEGATLNMDSLTFELNDGCTSRFIVISPLRNAVQCCKINLKQEPYVIQLLLFSGPARGISNKANLSRRMYDPESADSHVRFIQLRFDLKPSSEACEAINKILERIRSDSTVDWIIERDTISSDEIHDPPTTPASGISNNKKILKTYATRSKKSPLQAIKDNYTISDDDDDDVDNNDQVANDDEDFKSTCNTTNTFRRSTRSSSLSKIKPENDKLLLSYRPGTLARAVSIFLSDLDCLEEGEFLNDKIIDFYLKYLWYDKLRNDTNRNRVHVFSPFFHTRLVNSSFGGGRKGNQYDPELLHSRVKNWTKNVDLFSKELVILPVCQSSHWYVAVICHAGLYEATSSKSKSNSKSQFSSILNDSVELIESSGDVITGVLDEPFSTSTQDSPSSQACCHNDSNIRNKSLRPCILMLDSLGAQYRRNNTTAKIKRYLTAEWKHKHNDKEEKDFSNFIVLSQSKLKVPLQENSSDCGLFVLQYVETLLQRVILDNQAIPQTTEEWFTPSDISKKRNNLHELITTLSTTSDVT